MQDTPADHVLKLALIALSEAFDDFISECLINPHINGGQIIPPSKQAMMKARGYLPPYCKNAFRKEKTNETPT